jgi:hypothetical protein
MSELIITQYNMWKNKKKVMSIFFLKTVWRECEIIILQKSWQNFYMKITYCFNNSSFWSVYLQQYHSWICFLINKKLLILFWIMKHSKSDLFSLIFELEETMIHIHNMYLLFSEFLWDINREFLIYSLQNLLNKLNKHFLVRDFNVHHSTWKETKCTH